MSLILVFLVPSCWKAARESHGLLYDDQYAFHWLICLKKHPSSRQPRAAVPLHLSGEALTKSHRSFFTFCLLFHSLISCESQEFIRGKSIDEMYNVMCCLAIEVYFLVMKASCTESCRELTHDEGVLKDNAWHFIIILHVASGEFLSMLVIDQ